MILHLQQCSYVAFENGFFLNPAPTLTRHHRHFLGVCTYRDWPHCGLHSPRAERTMEKSAVTPSAMSVQTKKKPPLELAMPLATPTPFPFTWMTGTANKRSDPRRVMTYPDRRSASTRVP